MTPQIVTHEMLQKLQSTKEHAIFLEEEDKELIKLAAIEFLSHISMEGDLYFRSMYEESVFADIESGKWNPLQHSEQSLQIATILEFNIFHTGGRVYVVDGRNKNQMATVIHGDNRCAATRRAIVMVAASLGRERPPYPMTPSDTA
jgi:hypothetical protein